eukprot:Nitzschia sp. Nitz4//scaffold26_size159584//128046//128804//NITZ4_002513-RA/size159584-processed-gene-0.208-mRNA-1//1//CDS//3329545148//5200//frame0
MLPVVSQATTSHSYFLEALILNNQATQDMRSKRFASAAETLSLALRKLKEFVALAQCTRIVPDISVGVVNDWTTSASDRPLEEEEIGSSSSSSSTWLVTHPVTLSVDAPVQGIESYEVLVRIVSFGIISNLGICNHVQATLPTDDHGDDGMDQLALRKAIQLYTHAGELLLSLRRWQHFQLILLNNLGRAYFQIDQRLQAAICYQSLSIAAEQFKNTNSLYTNNTKIQTLIDNFLSRSVAFLTESASGASMA